jgi:hypothetical protein
MVLPHNPTLIVQDVMEIDNHPGDEADVESVGKSTGTSGDAGNRSRRSNRKSTSRTPRTSPESTRSRSRRERNSNPPKAKSPSPEPSPQPSVEVLEDEVEDENIVDGDEETFAVEKVIKHRIHKKDNVPPSIRFSDFRDKRGFSI